VQSEGLQSFIGNDVDFFKEKSVMSDPELLLRFVTFTLSAKGKVARYLVIPVSLVLIAIAWRIATW